MVRNLLLVVIASLVGLLLIEGMLRAFPSLLTEEAALRMHWRELGAARDSSGEPMVVDDPTLGFRYLPHRTGHFARGDFAFSFTTDGNGFRNPWPWPARADLVVVGDSMAFGYGVADEATWTHLVDAALPDSDVINLGMIGTGPPRYLEVLRRYGFELDPNLVLFTVFPGNDLVDTDNFDRWRASGATIGYRRWLATGGADEGDLGLIKQFLRRSYLVAVLRDIRATLASPFRGETLTLADGSRLMLAPTTYLHSVEMATPENPLFERVMGIIEEARELTLARGADFVVLLVPTKEEVYLGSLGRPHPALVEVFAEALSARGIAYLDLSSALEARAAEGEALYFPVDGHPNAQGYAVIAEAVLAYLAERDHPTKPLTQPKLD